MLLKHGFGFIVLYNGRVTKNLKSAQDAKQKGTTDAENAAKRAREEGFTARTIIFLDIEEGGRLSPAYHEYVHAWIDALARSNFRSGAYCSGIPLNDGDGRTITTAEDLREHLGARKLALWVFKRLPTFARLRRFAEPATGDTERFRASRDLAICADTAAKTAHRTMRSHL